MGLEIVGLKVGVSVVRIGHLVGRDLVGSLLGVFVGVLVIGASLGEDVGLKVGFVVTGFAVGSGWNIEYRKNNKQKTQMPKQIFFPSVCA